MGGRTSFPLVLSITHHLSFSHWEQRVDGREDTAQHLLPQFYVQVRINEVDLETGPVPGFGGPWAESAQGSSPMLPLS